MVQAAGVNTVSHSDYSPTVQLTSNDQSSQISFAWLQLYMHKTESSSSIVQPIQTVGNDWMLGDIFFMSHISKTLPALIMYLYMYIQVLVHCTSISVIALPGSNINHLPNRQTSHQEKMQVLIHYCQTRYVLI